MKHIVLFLVLTLVKVMPTQAQWYFETSIVDSKFTQSANKGGGNTDLESINGFRDLSYSFGRLFSINKVPKPGEEAYDAYIKEYQSPWLLFGLGIGFDQMSLKTNANNDGFITPNDYDMAQVHGRLGVYLMPTLFKINERPIQLNLSAAFVYDFFTHATQSIPTETTNLREFDEFDSSYPAYALGAGFSFFVNQSTRLYAKYEIETAFGLDEKHANGLIEDYSLAKEKISVGVLVDFKLRKSLKERAHQKIADLEAKLNTSIETIAAIKQTPANAAADLLALQNRIDSLEQSLHKHKDNNHIVKEIIEVKTHEKGFKYFTGFKHVLFPNNSSYFDVNVYQERLNNVVSYMNQNPTMKLSLVGYADKIGDSKYNKSISKLRAKRVYDSLISLGIEASRMEFSGAGETTQFSIGGLTDNRRTEIIINSPESE